MSSDDLAICFDVDVALGESAQRGGNEGEEEGDDGVGSFEHERLEFASRGSRDESSRPSPHHFVHSTTDDGEEVELEKDVERGGFRRQNEQSAVREHERIEDRDGVDADRDNGSECSDLRGE